MDFFQRGVLASNQNHAQANYNMGLLQEKLRHEGDAVRYSKKALQIDVDYVAARVNLANLLYKQGGLDEAIIHYTRALQIIHRFSRNSINPSFISM